MEKTCPNCQAHASFAEVTCPRCGSVLDNIKVSSGNLPENNPVASANPNTFPMDDSESVIMGKNAHNSPNITTNRNVNLNLIDHTSEEKFDVQWQAVEKDPSPHAAPNAPANKQSPDDKKDFLKQTQRRQGKDKSRSTRRTKNKQKNKVPFYFYIVFYGVPVLIIVALIGVIVYLKFIKRGPTPPKNNKPLWQQAQYSAGLAHISWLEYEDANQKNKTKKARRHLITSKKRYTKALKLGKQAFNKEIKKLMKKEKISNQEATKQIHKEFVGPRTEMDKWGNELNKILERLNQKQKE